MAGDLEAVEAFRVDVRPVLDVVLLRRDHRQVLLLLAPANQRAMMNMKKGA